jgi:hypothetical protein
VGLSGLEPLTFALSERPGLFGSCVRAQDCRTWSVTKPRVVLHSFTLFVRLVSPKGGGEMAGFGEVLEQYHRTLAAFIQGDPEPTLRPWSKCDDVTLANPFGPPVRG